MTRSCTRGASAELISGQNDRDVTCGCLGCRVGYILNVTREIDNFFPGMFSYLNVRVYDEEATDLLAHWNDTYNFIVKAK